MGERHRTALVTGGNRGLGRETCRQLAARGLRVLLAARTEKDAAEAAGALDANGTAVLPCALDVASASSIAALAQQLTRDGTTVDVLVNNAGVARVRPALDEAPADFREVLDTNLVGAFTCAQRFGRVMVENRKGSIINIASILGFVGIGLVPQASYAASKGGIVNLTRELATQWARLGIRVNAIAPGWFPSEMASDMVETEDGQKFIRRRTPMGRAGEPKELLGVLLLLASDASSFMTGQIIAVDGGWTII